MTDDSRLSSLTAIFQDALDRRSFWGIDRLFLSAALSQKRGVSVFEGERDSVEIADEIKIGVWLSVGDRWGTASLERIDGKLLAEAIQNAQAAAALSDPDPDYTLAPALKKSSLSNPHQPNPVLLSTDMATLENWAKILDQKARTASSQISNVPYAASGVRHTHRLLMNSEGLWAQEENALLTAILSVSATGKSGRIANVEKECVVLNPSDFNPHTLADAIAREALSRLDPRPVPSGSFPILFDPRMAAELLATFFPLWSGDLLYRGLSRLRGKRGETIAAPFLSLRDRGPAGLVPHEIDAEGSPVLDKWLLKDGVLTEFLHNRYTAKKLGDAPGGNADGGIGVPPGVSAANLSWESKRAAPQAELLRLIPRGLLITELHGASASPVSGDFSYGALGYWIENGEIAYPAADFALAGNFLDLLLRIAGIGDDLAYFHPHPFGSFGGRSLLVDGLQVSGQ